MLFSRNAIVGTFSFFEALIRQKIYWNFNIFTVIAFSVFVNTFNVYAVADSSPVGSPPFAMPVIPFAGDEKNTNTKLSEKSKQNETSRDILFSQSNTNSSAIQLNENGNNVSTTNNNIVKKQKNVNPEQFVPMSKKTIEMEPDEVPYVEGEFGSWFVLSLKMDKGKRKCYMVSYPFDSVGNHKAERKAYMMAIFDEYKRHSLTLTAGYSFCKNSVVEISVSGKHFGILAKDYFAVPKTAMEDINIISAMLDSSRVLVHGRSDTGTYSVDTYSLDGFQEGYRKMFEICNKKTR